jgi:hypothetical protein
MCGEEEGFRLSAFGARLVDGCRLSAATLTAGCWLLAVSAGAAWAQVAAAPPRNDYSRPESWLCRPDRNDACAADLTTTVVGADGGQRVEKWTGDKAAPIDCFYVYPTVSLDATPNSDMTPGPEERRVAAQQFARFGAACRLYAPLYRQVTLSALMAGLAGKFTAADRSLAYNDLLDAWRYYLEHDNVGRGVVVIGHSQGAQLLTQLIRAEVDGKPVQERLVSAILPGASIAVPRGKDAGGVFAKIPVCRHAGQVGCVISYASFRADAPPPAVSFFGRVAGSDRVAACTNPASLEGGIGELQAYFPSTAKVAATGDPVQWSVSGPPPAGPFVRLPGLVWGECVSNEHGSYLAVSIRADGTRRARDIPGDTALEGKVQPAWGLHLVDVNLAIGNLVEIVKAQGRAYQGGKRGPGDYSFITQNCDSEKRLPMTFTITGA